MKIARIGLNYLFGGALLGLTACNSAGTALKEDPKQNEATQLATAASTETTEAAKEENQELAKVIKRKGGVQNRGAFIKVLVNKTPITNFDIQRRAKFLALRRVPGNRTKIAENEMIEQALKLEEAKRRRTTATKEQVDTAFASFAKQNRATVPILSRELGKLGVGAPHFRDFIKTQISWQRTIQGKFQSETTRISEQEAIQQLRENGNQKPKVNEFSFKQVIFVVPKNKRSKAALAVRRREANAFRQTINGCDNLLQSIKSLKDVSIIDRRHIMEPELPSRWKDHVAKAGAGKATPVQETDRGVEFMAVCDSRVVDDDRAAKVAQQSTDFTQFGDKATEFSKEYLDELRGNATIVYQ